MKYGRIEEARFLSRPNRFIAHCMIGGKPVTAHVKNTGRCRELLVPGCTVYLEHAGNENRKTEWSLVTVKKGRRLINMDSQAPNTVFYEALQSGRICLPGKGVPTLIKREVTFGDSRFDLYVEWDDKKFFIEMKGVTLEDQDIVLFPDAPTQRGEKHIRGLINAVKQGYYGAVVFVIQMGEIKYFTPNWETDPAFGRALEEAKLQGVDILAYDCYVTPEEVICGDAVPVILHP